MKKLITILLLVASQYIFAADLLIETENFKNKGGWVVDQRFMELMGFPYLMAHGMGVPIDDASTEIQMPENGVYNVYVRTFNWTSPWYNGERNGYLPEW